MSYILVFWYMAPVDAKNECLVYCLALWDNKFVIFCLYQILIHRKYIRARKIHHNYLFGMVY